MKKITSVFMFFLGMLLVVSQQTVNNNTTICWDVSASMVDRDLNKELELLDKVIKRNPNQEIQLLLFGIDVAEKKYTITAGDWSQLKEDIENVTYDGGTLYNVLKGNIKNPNVYVFTDGQKTLTQDQLSLNGKSFLINSSPNRNAKFLERTALLHKSRLIDFAAMLPENIKKLQQKSVKKQIAPKSLIKGTVYIDNKPEPNVRVGLKGISDSFLTDTSGGFSIPASIGDTLVITSRTSKTIKTIPVEIIAHINVFMASNIVALDEVILVEKKIKKTEMTLTGFGMQSKEAIGYTVSELEEKDVSHATTNIGDAINTKVAGLKIPSQNAWERGAGGLGAAVIRGKSSILTNRKALVVINGVPMQRSTLDVNVNMDYVDPENIAKITVLKGLAATNAWGSEGAGGVILIITKTAVQSQRNNGKPVDRALLKNNVYDEPDGGGVVDANPTLSALKASDSSKEAYDTYLSLRSINRTNVKFYLDAFDYFKKRDKKTARKIISNLLEWNTENVATLRVVSKAFSTIEDHENAILVNSEIIKISPTDVNAYFNNAMAKSHLGKHQDALKELLALERGDTYFSVNASGISKTLKREIKSLIAKHKSKLNLANIEAEYLNNVKYKVRMVFEWNEPGAAFELQFVNPQKRFFNWEHTNLELKERIEDELKNNYRIEEYEFYGDVAGKWIINAKYLGKAKNLDDTPLVLKVTIYKDFGYVTQTQERILVHFSKLDEKKNLKTLLVK